jgi:hypothetical protein
MIQNMARLIVIAVLAASLSASAATFTLDPDNYANGADLTHAIPQVTLLTAITSDNQTVVPSWYISAVNDAYTSTGSNAFGYLNFHSLWDGRRLRMDFSDHVSSVSIDFISFSNDAGELHIFDSNWNEIGTGFTTGILPGHQVQTMTLTSGAADIMHAVAYSQGTGFGRLDDLQFTMIPEPGCSALAAAALATLAFWRRRNESN